VKARVVFRPLGLRSCVARRPSRANHFGAIRSIRAKSDAAERRRKPLAEKILHKLVDMLNAALRLFAVSVRSAPQRRARRALANGGRSENPYFIGIFDNADVIHVRHCLLVSGCVWEALTTMVETQDVVSMRAPERLIMQKRWFFCRAVVIRKECSRSPRVLDDIATHSWLGGQHGEEA
jgi:hypothetical protein